MSSNTSPITIEQLSAMQIKHIKKLATLIEGERAKYPTPKATTSRETYIKNLLNDPYSAGAHVILCNKAIVGALWLQNNIVQADKSSSSPQEIWRVIFYFSNRTNSSQDAQKSVGQAAAEFLAITYRTQLRGTSIYSALPTEHASVAETTCLEHFSHYNGVVVPRASMERRLSVPYKISREIQPQCEIVPFSNDHVKPLLKTCWVSHKEVGDLPHAADMASEEVYSAKMLKFLETSRLFSFIQEASFTALHDNVLVGGVWVIRPMRSPDTAMILQIFVDPKLQGKGVGRSLLETSIIATEKLNTFSAIELQVSTHISTPDFYKKFGFEVITSYKEFGFLDN